MIKGIGAAIIAVVTPKFVPGLICGPTLGGLDRASRLEFIVNLLEADLISPKQGLDLMELRT